MFTTNQHDRDEPVSEPHSDWHSTNRCGTRTRTIRICIIGTVTTGPSANYAPAFARANTPLVILGTPVSALLDGAPDGLGYSREVAGHERPALFRHACLTPLWPQR